MEAACLSISTDSTHFSKNTSNLLSLAPEPYEPSMRWLVNLHLGIQFNLMLQLPEMQNVYNRMSLLFYFETPGGL